MTSDDLKNLTSLIVILSSEEAASAGRLLALGHAS